jgi:hypothetical protein
MTKQMNKKMFKSMYKWLSMALLNHKSFGGFFKPLIQLFLPKWNPGLYGARIVAIKDENASVFSLILKINKHWPGFQAGQYIELCIERNGALITRIFSLSSAPTLFKDQLTIRLTIAKQKQG